MPKTNPKHIVDKTKKDKIVLVGVGDFLEYYTVAQRRKSTNKLTILYLSSENELVGEHHIVEIHDSMLLFINILGCILSSRGAKLVVFRSEPNSALLPTQEDMVLFSKLQIFTHLIEIEMKDYLVLTEESYYSFSLHSDAKSYC